MDRIEKALRKLNNRERQRIKQIIARLAAGNVIGLDLQKLKGHDDIYRVRVGDLRIIFRRGSDGIKFILAIERRSNSTYRNY